MLIVLSPAKSLNFVNNGITKASTIPAFAAEASRLAGALRKMNAHNLSQLMGISSNLANLNYERYQTWDPAPEKSKQALLAFDGDVYDGFDALSLKEEDLLCAQKHLRILSGLYGVLRPLDLIQPHRLEMGTKLKINRHKDLYSFWKKNIVSEINNALMESGSNILINLASNEYIKSIHMPHFKGDVLNIEFKDLKNGQYKIVSFFAKKARGMMARFIIENRIENPDHLKAFDSDGYHFSPVLSTERKLVFTRDH